VNKSCLIAFCLLLSGLSNAQSTRKLHFDLSKIGMVLDGEQVCNDTNPRLQDIPSKMMDRIIAGKEDSVPVLISLLADQRMAQTREPILCYWPGMRTGDIAFCLLTSLFMDTQGKTTVPGASWNEMLGPADKPAWDQLHAFIRKNGAAALQAKWRLLWRKYGSQTSWDESAMCFRLKVAK
jgi:hypothetical protein